MKIFFDTNVLFSAFLSSKSPCFLLFSKAILSGGFVTGEFVLEELEKALIKRSSFSPADIQAFISDFRGLEIIPTPKEPSPIAIRDPDDAYVLASALEAKADYLVTGDKDLLTLGHSAGIKIVDPRTLLDLLEKG